jgi:tetratricopeptide (TPR) repeat protein
MFEDADRSFQEVLRLDPMSARAHNQLGITCYLRRDVNAATSQFEESCRLEPAYVTAYFNLATILIEEGKLDAAARKISIASAQCVSRCEISYYSGVIDDIQGNRESAVANYREALRLNPALLTPGAFPFDTIPPPRQRTAEALSADLAGRPLEAEGGL